MGRGGGGVWPSYVPKSHTFCVVDDAANGFLLPTLSPPPTPQNTPKSNVPLSCTITISPTNSSQKRSTLLYNHNISNPPVTENAPLSCISTICPTIRHKKFYSPVQSQFLQPTRYRKRSTFLYKHNMSNHPSQKSSTVLYNHNISNPPVTENVPLSCTITISPSNSSQIRSTFLFNHNVSKPTVTENVLLPCTITPSLPTLSQDNALPSPYSRTAQSRNCLLFVTTPVYSNN